MTNTPWLKDEPRALVSRSSPREENIRLELRYGSILDNLLTHIEQSVPGFPPVSPHNHNYPPQKLRHFRGYNDERGIRALCGPVHIIFPEDMTDNDIELNTRKWQRVWNITVNYKLLNGATMRGRDGSSSIGIGARTKTLIIDTLLPPTPPVQGLRIQEIVITRKLKTTA